MQGTKEDTTARRCSQLSSHRRPRENELIGVHRHVVSPDSEGSGVVIPIMPGDEGQASETVQALMDEMALENGRGADRPKRSGPSCSTV